MSDDGETRGGVGGKGEPDSEGSEKTLGVIDNVVIALVVVMVLWMYTESKDCQRML